MGALRSPWSGLPGTKKGTINPGEAWEQLTMASWGWVKFWTRPCKAGVGARVEVGAPGEGHRARTEGTKQPASLHKQWAAWLEGVNQTPEQAGNVGNRGL